MSTDRSFEDENTPAEHPGSSDRGPWANEWHPTWSKAEKKAQDEASSRRHATVGFTHDMEGDVEKALMRRYNR